MKLIYLACPYSHKESDVRDFRFRLVTRVAGVLITKGYNVFSPITHSHLVASFTDLGTCWDYWGEMDTQILLRCDELWVLTESGWSESVGVLAEIEIAKEKGMKIVFIDPVEIFDNSIFEKFYMDNYPKMLNYVAKKIRNPPYSSMSRSLTNTIFMETYRCWDTFDSSKSSQRINWAFGVARNIVNGYIRKRTRRQDNVVNVDPQFLESLSGSDVSGTKSIEDAELIDLIRTSSSEKLTEVMDLKREGYTFKEISKKLDIPLNTAASRLRLVKDSEVVKKLKEDRDVI